MPYDKLITDARAFLHELADNNTRDWFLDNKARYDTDLKAPALALLDQGSADLAKLTGLPVSPKLFRPQRDIRFSKDKTPYKTHLHMLWDVGQTGAKTAFFFGIESKRTVLGGGCMKFEKDKLTAFRSAVDTEEGQKLERAITEAREQGIRFSEPELARVPPPFAQDHPRGALLRHKSLTFWRDLPEDVTNLRATLKDGFAELMPLQTWMLQLG